MNKICLVAIDIRSAHNVGSFFRTADAFGATIVLVGISPRPKGATPDERLPHVISKTDSAISKTALGAEKTVDWRYYETYNQAIDALKSEGYKIAAIEQDKDSRSIYNLALSSKSPSVALVVGPEVEGLPSELLRLCDAVYEIPMQGSKESLNVAVAAGIALYQATGSHKH